MIVSISYKNSMVHILLHTAIKHTNRQQNVNNYDFVKIRRTSILHNSQEYHFQIILISNYVEEY